MNIFERDRNNYCRRYTLLTSVILQWPFCSASVPCTVPWSHFSATEHKILPWSHDGAALFDIVLLSPKTVPVHHTAPSRTIGPLFHDIVKTLLTYVSRRINVATCFRTLIFQHRLYSNKEIRHAPCKNCLWFSVGDITMTLLTRSGPILALGTFSFRFFRNFAFRLAIADPSRWQLSCVAPQKSLLE